MPAQHRIRLLFLNVGHTYDHLFMLLYATAVLSLEGEMGLGYSELIALATPGFIAFGAGAIPSGWLGDHWSRTGMMTLFFVGIGLASIATSLATGPLGLGLGLFCIGVFASIYHPVGIAMVVEGAEKVGIRLGVNGVYGNMGVAGAALVAGALIDFWSWRAAFVLPGILSIVTGVAFYLFIRANGLASGGAGPKRQAVPFRLGWQRVLIVIAVANIAGGLVFTGSTVSLPKVFDERLGAITESAFGVGALVAIVYAVAAFTQIAVGHLIDRYPARLIYVAIALANVPVMLLAVGAQDWAMLAAGFAMMVFLFGQIPIADALVAGYTPDRWRARVYAVKYVLNFGVAATAVPMIAWLHGKGGFATFYMVLAACSLVVAAAALALPGRMAQAAAQPAE
jgi:MFS family permease